MKLLVNVGFAVSLTSVFLLAFPDLLSFTRSSILKFDEELSKYQLHRGIWYE